MKAGLAVQVLLFFLIAMSIVSWAIVIKKWNQFKLLNDKNAKFLDLFWSASTLDQVHTKADHHDESSLARVFTFGFKELEKIKRTNLKDPQFVAFALENLESALRKGQDQEIGALEDRLSFLATTGSTAPFIGLLGTVIGIMNSFRDIYNAGSASLATVAPGISEALFATAVGLFAAIPAVIAYNFLLTKVRQQENGINEFIGEFLNLARLEFIKKP